MRTLARSPYAAATVAMLFWSGTFIMVRGIAVGVPPIGLSFWRGVIAALAFTFWAAPHLAADVPGLARRWKHLAFLGFTQNGLGNAASVIALHTTTVINASIVNAMISPMIVFAAWAIYRETITVRQALGVAVSVLGVLVLIARADIGVILHLAFVRGDVWIFVAVANWALFAITVRRFTEGLHPISALAAMSWLAVVEVLPFYVWEHTSVAQIVPDATFFTSALYLGLLPSVLCISLWTRALKMLGPQRASVFQYMIPVFSVVLGIVLLGERLHPYHIVGAALVACGIWLTAIARRKHVRNMDE